MVAQSRDRGRAGGPKSADIRKSYNRITPQTDAQL
jgi:hypothetical protein